MASSSALKSVKRKRRFKAGDTVKIRMGNSISKVQVLEARGLGPNGEVMLRVALSAEAGCCASPPTTFEVMGYSVL